MKMKVIAYWITLVLFSLAMLGGGFADLTQNEKLMEGMRKLGYPDYFALIIGFWKVMGVVAILLPRLGHLKEWAYAGFFYDLTGATASHLFMKDALPEPLIPLVLLVIGAVSWHLRPASRCVGTRTEGTQA